MKIDKVAIHNFRSIIDASFSMKDYSLVIGANNSGKTAVVDAIRCFYEADKESKFVRDKDFPKSGATDDESWVEITYSLSDDENASLKVEYQSPDHLLCLRKYLLANKPKEGTIFFKSHVGNVSETSFYGAKNVQGGKIGDLIYIPALSKVDDQAKLTGPSALRDLLVKIMESVVEESNPYKEFADGIQKFSTAIASLENDDHRSLKGFESKFNDSIAPWGAKFSLGFKTPSSADMVKNMVTWALTDKELDAEQTIERYGSGFQRHFIYSLIRLSAEFLPHAKSSKSKDFCPTFTLLLFEEPEAFLHPQQQDELSRNLKNIGAKDSWQVLCTSHSPHFISHNMEDVSSLVRLQKKGALSFVRQIDDNELTDLFSPTFDATKYPVLAGRYNGKSDEELESLKFAIWLNPHRAGVFFASKVLLVEGPTEQVLVNKMIEERSLVLPSGTFVLDCFGKHNLFRFMRLMWKLGINHSVLHDKDKPNDVEHAEWNRLTQDTRNEFTDKIEVVDPDIEGVLGAERSQGTGQKPQRLLHQYVMKKLDAAKVEAFRALISSMMR